MPYERILHVLLSLFLISMASGLYQSLKTLADLQKQAHMYQDAYEQQQKRYLACQEALQALQDPACQAGWLRYHWQWIGPHETLYRIEPNLEDKP